MCSHPKLSGQDVKCPVPSLGSISCPSVHGCRNLVGFGGGWVSMSHGGPPLPCAPTTCSVEGSALTSFVAAIERLECKSHGAQEKVERCEFGLGGKGQLSGAAHWCGM